MNLTWWHASKQQQQQRFSPIYILYIPSSCWIPIYILFLYCERQPHTFTLLLYTSIIVYLNTLCNNKIAIVALWSNTCWTEAEISRRCMRLFILFFLFFLFDASSIKKRAFTVMTDEIYLYTKYTAAQQHMLQLDIHTIEPKVNYALLYCNIKYI